MKKFLCTLLLVSMIGVAMPCYAGGVNGKITPKSIGAAVCSGLIWPGIGQVINDQNKEKDVTHAILGLTGIFRIWSAYDAFVDRDGGVWDGRI